ncbi:aminotransferase class I/II-fold pyridoxal phosphate-dependent enzyme [Halosegnis rubeus]|jgi:O-acetylhomoserine (thiol)-lyase|uniref:Aminotransferase class I/II-fold pyridoxal phosphate-dependent enzyme n=1 Tax=Halosegnis rubeus TaxID=2212850 RepID=A0A5N5UBN2_9EURY|nr:O-acetylhomoserine aminocarboxypropyltransferase/cysteine synthase family protein [Halosegnis rubeus]KAB7516065.1 aminotransferase class I/II-fold pyridoxal phosphate-dependent enzyme [Halosegnis rubeus]KAB7520147.1 aminotransferase class I/II-fold pyridoxal phosphate-dependent enzyme [Halosegnis rubeus]
MNTLGFDTRALHAGDEGDPATGAASLPIHQTTSYEFESAEQAAELYALEGDDHMYSRMSNPTTDVLERRLAALHGGTGACATASGMAAFDAATLVLAEPGDNVVSAASIYGGTHAYLNHTAARRGIEARFVDTLDPEAYAEAIDEKTAYIHLETIGNPSLVTPPIEEIAEVAHDHDVPLFVDNTFATPALCRPFGHGADLVWESTTKWIHGSGTTVGGILVDGGEFDWHAGDYPEVTANAAFDGLDFTQRYGDRAFEYAVRQRSLRSLGDQQSPFDAWATLQGVQTLGLRMERHCENALAVAEYLDANDDVAWVNYPGLERHETHDLASEYLDGYGGMVTFGLEDGYEGGTRVCESVEVATFLANIGDSRTLVIHPASTTHAQLSEAEQRASGVTPDLLRLSVGIENSEDIIADLEGAI